MGGSTFPGPYKSQENRKLGHYIYKNVQNFMGNPKNIGLDVISLTLPFEIVIQIKTGISFSVNCSSRAKRK